MPELNAGCDVQETRIEMKAAWRGHWMVVCNCDFQHSTHKCV